RAGLPLHDWSHATAALVVAGDAVVETTCMSCGVPSLPMIKANVTAPPRPLFELRMASRVSELSTYLPDPTAAHVRSPARLQRRQLALQSLPQEKRCVHP